MPADPTRAALEAVAEREHELKTWPEQYDAIVRGEKRFELRRSDRLFCVGDVLHLRRYDPNGRGYTGTSMRVRVTYLTSGLTWGFDAGWVVMSISPLAPTPDPRDAVVEAARAVVAVPRGYYGIETSREWRALRQAVSALSPATGQGEARTLPADETCPNCGAPLACGGMCVSAPCSAFGHPPSEGEGHG